MRRLLKNATLVDGSGHAAYPGDLLIEDEHICEVGTTSLRPDDVIDLEGAVLAPGFIDVHSHSDFTLPGDPDAHAKTLQGVSTEVVCNCGLGLQPANAAVEKYYNLLSPMLFGEKGGTCFSDLNAYREGLESRGISVNVACLVPHGNVRCAVMGVEERKASTIELEHMKDLIEEGMSQGAFGLSTGLVYPPGAFADIRELVELAKCIRSYDGVYTTHMRNESNQLEKSLREAINIGKQADVSVQISHHKAAGRFNWGKVKKTLRMVEKARKRGLNIHSDVYPYTAGSTVLSALFLPLWAFEGEPEELLWRLQDPDTRKRIQKDSEAQLLKFMQLPGLLDRIAPKRALIPIFLKALAKEVIISSVKHQHCYEGLRLSDIAKARGQNFWECLLDLLYEEETAVVAIAHLMQEEDVQRVLKHPTTMVGTDGFPQKDGKPHPRTYGTYPRILQHYVNELGLLGLEEAVHKMTGMIANKMGIHKRGILKPGYHADLVVFSPPKVKDRATYFNPRNAPEGFHHLFVNGQWTVRDGKHTGVRGGRVLRRNA